MDRSTQVCMYLFTSILFAFITSCSCSPTNSSYQQCQTLLAFKEGVHDPTNALSSWINGSDCCGWKGVGCDVITEVVTLNISFAGLNGTVNEGLFELKSFVHLNLSNNEFRGGIPKTIGSLQRLKYLNVANSGFSGVIPPHLANLSRLHFLDLSSLVGWDSDNALNYYYLKSEDLAWLKNLRELQYLSLSGVELNGMAGQQWGENIGHLYNLQTLHLSYCNLFGTISSSIFNISSLTLLDLYSNQIGGTIPSSIANLSCLTTLDLSANQLSGGIPPSLARLSSLVYLSLFDNDLNGSIPITCLCRLSHLYWPP